MNEHEEAAVIDSLNKQRNRDPKDNLFKIRKDAFDYLIAKGMPHDSVGKFLGKLRVSIPEKVYGGDLYRVALEVCLDNAFLAWQAYAKDMHEQIFFDTASLGGYIIILPEEFA